MSTVTPSRIRRSSYDSPRPRFNAKAKGISKSRSGNNPAAKGANSLRINTDAVGAMIAHCSGDLSPQSGNLIVALRRTSPPSIDIAMIETGDEAMRTPKSQTTPLTLALEIWRTVGGGWWSPGVRKKPLGGTSTSASPGHTVKASHPPAEMPVINEAFLSSDTPSNSTLLHGSSARSCTGNGNVEGTEGIGGTTPRADLQTTSDKPWPFMGPGEKSASQLNIDKNELSPIPSPISSDIDLPFATRINLGISTCSSSPVADGVAPCNGDAEIVNEGQQLEQKTADNISSSTADVDHQSVDDCTISAMDSSSFVESDPTRIDHENSSLIEQGAPSSQSDHETVQLTHSIDISGDMLPPADEERRQADASMPEGKQINVSTGEAKNPTTSFVPDAESEGRVTKNDAEQLEETYTPTDKVASSPIPDSAAPIPEVEHSFNAAKVPLVVTLINGSGETNELSGTLPSETAPNAPPEHIDEPHFQAPITSTTSSEPATLEAMGESSVPDVSEVSNVTEPHVATPLNEASDEVCKVRQDPFPVEAPGIHVSSASASSTSPEFHPDPTVPSNPAASSTAATSKLTDGEIDPEPADNVEAQPLSRASKRKHKKQGKAGTEKQLTKKEKDKSKKVQTGRKKLQGGGEIDVCGTALLAPSVQNLDEKQNDCDDSDPDDNEDPGPSSPNVSNSGCDRSTKIESNKQDAAVNVPSLNGIDNGPPEFQMTGGHVSATSEQGNKALPTTSSDQDKPEPSLASKDIALTIKTQQDSSTSQTDPVQTENEIGSGVLPAASDVNASGTSPTNTLAETQQPITAENSSSSDQDKPEPSTASGGISPTESQSPSTPQISQSDPVQTEDLGEKSTASEVNASRAPPTDAPPATEQHITDDSNDSDKPKSPASEDALQTNETEQGGSAAQTPQPDSVEAGNSIEMEDEQGQTTVNSSDTPLADTLSATPQQGHHSSIAQASPDKEPARDAIEPGKAIEEVADADTPSSSPSSSSTETSATSKQTTDDDTSSPATSPIDSKPGKEASPTATTHDEEPTAQTSPSSSFQKGDLIDFEGQATGPISGAADSSLMDTPPVTSTESGEGTRNSPITPLIIDSSEDVLSVSETHHGDSATQISQPDLSQAVILVDVEEHGDVDEPSASVSTSTDAPFHTIHVPNTPESSLALGDVSALDSPVSSISISLGSPGWSSVGDPHELGESGVEPTRETLIPLVPEEIDGAPHSISHAEIQEPGEERNHWQENCEEMRGKYEETQREYDELQKKYDELKKKYDELEGKYDELEKKYKDAPGEHA